MKYLTFLQRPRREGRKTDEVAVFGRRDTYLGEIKWFGRWRQYAFFPEAGTVWNTDCLAEVSAQILKLMAARRDQA
jgi:hypothetical protein